MKKGIVKEYDTEKGFGFIKGQNGDDYFGQYHLILILI